jgi:hypothetical protein
MEAGLIVAGRGLRVRSRLRKSRIMADGHLVCITAFYLFFAKHSTALFFFKPHQQNLLNKFYIVLFVYCILLPSEEI